MSLRQPRPLGIELFHFFSLESSVLIDHYLQLREGYGISRHNNQNVGAQVVCTSDRVFLRGWSFLTPGTRMENTIWGSEIFRGAFMGV